MIQSYNPPILLFLTFNLKHFENELKAYEQEQEKLEAERLENEQKKSQNRRSTRKKVVSGDKNDKNTKEDNSVSASLPRTVDIHFRPKSHIFKKI